MRTALVIILALLVPAAGCFGGTDSDDASALPVSGETGGEVDGGPEAIARVEAPDHPIGTAWTYRNEEFYNPDDEFTIVVASNGSSGYHFAAGAQDDLIYHAMWRSSWFGPHDGDLNPAAAPGRWLRFPLEDGKTWQSENGWSATAHATTIATPLGTEDGFRIEARSERWFIQFDYSPAIGQITTYEGGPLATGDVFDRVVMTSVSTADEWVWYELGEVVSVPSPDDPQTFEVPSGYDQVIASAGGRDGARAVIRPPSGSPWSATFEGEEQWMHAVFDAEPGRWSASVVGRPFLDAPEPPADYPIGWAHLQLAPVVWTTTVA